MSMVVPDRLQEMLFDCLEVEFMHVLGSNVWLNGNDFSFLSYRFISYCALQVDNKNKFELTHD